jgi:uncharacterized protein (UPF0276 family)
VKEEVWSLLEAAYRVHGVRPTLLERDFNFPAMPVLLAEVERVRTCQRAASAAQSFSARA